MAIIRHLKLTHTIYVSENLTNLVDVEYSFQLNRLQCITEGSVCRNAFLSGLDQESGQLYQASL